METFLRAPAKINLFLWISPRGEDGFHPITSVMQTVSLWDDLSLSVNSGSEISIRVEGADLPLSGENLAVRAAQKFYGELRSRRSVDIFLRKRIPVSAGLGGGSSDAAAVLVGLNELHERPFSLAQLREMAALLGSDVPFFVEGGTALCRGRGEIMEYLPPFESSFVLVAPHFPISTAWAYREWDSKGKGTSVESRKLDGKRWLKHLGQNDFESVLLWNFPKLKNWKDRLHELGAGAVGISGSGPSVYGKFADSKEAEEAAEQLPRFDADIFMVQALPAGVALCAPSLSLAP